MAEQEQLCHRLLRHRSKIRDNELPENSSLIFPPFHLRNNQVEQRFWLSETNPNYKPDCHPERQVCPSHHCQNYLSQHCRDFLWWAAKLPCYQLHQVRSCLREQANELQSADADPQQLMHFFLLLANHEYIRKSTFRRFQHQEFDELLQNDLRKFQECLQQFVQSNLPPRANDDPRSRR